MFSIKFPWAVSLKRELAKETQTRGFTRRKRQTTFKQSWSQTVRILKRLETGKRCQGPYPVTTSVKKCSSARMIRLPLKQVQRSSQMNKSKDNLGSSVITMV